MSVFTEEASRERLKARIAAAERTWSWEDQRRGYPVHVRSHYRQKPTRKKKQAKLWREFAFLFVVTLMVLLIVSR